MELKYSDRVSVLYHNIFNYPLTLQELKKWKAGRIVRINTKSKIVFKNGYYLVSGKEKTIKSRKRNERNSVNKRSILKKLESKLKLIPSIKFVGITGALAMNNANDSGDIDLIVIVSEGKLWTTRLLVYLLIKIYGFEVRSPKNSNQKNKFCLNMWLDENDLVWPKNNRNLYTAHEISQIVPVINRDNTYESFIYKNRWITKFWPNAVDIKSINNSLLVRKKRSVSKTLKLIEDIAFFLQYQYMKPKVTREMVTKTKAIFHPKNWSNLVFSKLDY